MTHSLLKAKNSRQRLQLAIFIGLTGVSGSHVSVSAQTVDDQTRVGWDCQPNNAGEWHCEEVNLLGASVINPNSETASKNTRYDWIPKEHLSKEQQKSLGAGCCGAFISPAPKDPAPPHLAPTIIEFDDSSASSEKVAEFTGNVEIQNGELSLRADEIKLDDNNGDAEMSGNIEIRQPGLLFRGTQAQMNRETLSARIENAEFVLHEQRLNGSAEVLNHSDSGLLSLEDSEFSTCEPDDKQWYLRGKQITVDSENHRGTAKNITLYAFDVPVFYSPYLVFPVGDERLSGFLFPTVSSDGVSIPYYLNLAPNYDLTLAPRYVVDRGSMLEAEFRHLSPWFENELAIGWLGSGKDDISDNERRAIDAGLSTEAGLLFTEDEATKYKGEDRWAASLQQNGGLGYDWDSRIDYTKVSDVDYFRHLDTTNVEVNKATHLLQSGSVGYNLEQWRLGAHVEAYQTILEGTQEPYRQIPRLTADGFYNWGNVELSLDHQYTQFQHREEFYNPSSPDDPYITGDRFRTDYKASWNQEWLWGFFKPSAMLKSLSYRLDSSTIAAGREDSPSIVVPQGAIDMGMFFERDGSWFGDGYLQTFEPRLFYFYSDFESHADLYNLSAATNPNAQRDVNFDTGEMTFSYNQLFRDTRFSGGDRIEDANQVSIGLTTRFLGSDTGVERFRLSLGQIFYQDNQRVTLNGIPLSKNRSEIAGQFAAQLTDSWRFSSDVLYDHEDNVVTDGNVGLRYLDDEYRIFNISYRYTRNPERFDSDAGRLVDNDDSQGDVSFLWPLNERWSLIGRANYDFTNDRELDSIFGLEYNSCCYRVRLVGRHWLDEDIIDIVGSLNEEDIETKKGIFFEFQFKGLGGIGNRLSNMLSETVINHDKREMSF